MKILFNVNYMNHAIKVTNKWNSCSLVIDDLVMDTYKSLVAGNFTLKGEIENENQKVEIIFKLENSFPRCKLFLTVNGQQLAMKKMFM